MNFFGECNRQQQEEERDQQKCSRNTPQIIIQKDHKNIT